MPRFGTIRVLLQETALLLEISHRSPKLNLHPTLSICSLFSILFYLQVTVFGLWISLKSWYQNSTFTTMIVCVTHRLRWIHANESWRVTSTRYQASCMRPSIMISIILWGTTYIISLTSVLKVVETAQAKQSLSDKSKIHNCCLWQC